MEKKKVLVVCRASQSQEIRRFRKKRDHQGHEIGNGGSDETGKHLIYFGRTPLGYSLCDHCLGLSFLEIDTRDRHPVGSSLLVLSGLHCCCSLVIFFPFKL